MLDLVEIREGLDLQIADSVVMKAANVLRVQIGSLEYAPDFGVDLKYFLETGFQIQNESFKAYLIQRLTENQINVSQCIETLEALFSKYTFYVDDANKNLKGLIA